MTPIAPVETLPTQFNALVSSPRLLMVLSPSCADCLAGAAVVASVGVEGVLAIWTDMRPGDSAALAARAAADLPAGFLHFWEGEPWPVSTSLRPILGLGPYDETRSAWDVHLFYASGTMWTGPLGSPPNPTAWAYNLVDDPGVGVRLDAELVRRWFA